MTMQGTRVFPAIEPAPSQEMPAWTRAEQVSFRHCHQVTRRQARNFYYGLRLTPEPKRSAMYAVYAFMRACDDLADDAQGGPDEIARRIQAFREQVHRLYGEGPDAAASDGAFWPAFRYVVRQFGINRAHLDAMLDGQLADLSVTHYDTFDELYAYCYRVASVVGLVCLQVWGYHGGSATRMLAEYRGVALQLTNIIRDIAEDAQRGRVYLPREDLKRFGYTEDQLTVGEANQAFDRLIVYQIERARGYYDMSNGLEAQVTPDCRPTCWVMMRIYRELLEKIAADPRRVLTTRVSLSPVGKLSLGVRAMLKHSFG